MVFGSGNKFRLGRSQSKASYLAHRRERDRIAPDSETGSYKRTMSPNGHALSPEETQRLDTRETMWPLHKLTKDTRNNNVIRRSSMNDKRKEKCDAKQDLRKHLVLPDVLPMNVKLAGPRSQEYKRQTQLSLSPANTDISAIKSLPKSRMQSPASSPRSSPPSPSNVLCSFIPTSTATTVAVSSAVISTPTVKFSLNILNSTPNVKAPASSPPRTPSGTPPRTPPVIGFETKTFSIPRCSPVSTSDMKPSNYTTSHRTSPTSPPLQKSSPPVIKPTLSPNYTTKISTIRTSPHNITPLTNLTGNSSMSSAKSTTSLSLSPVIAQVSPPNSPTLISPPTSPPPNSLASSDSISFNSPVTTEDYPKVVEGLQMIQRTEVVVRVNTSTTDASSQTELQESHAPLLPTVNKLQEEIECEKLAEAFIDHIPKAVKLKELLVPIPQHKKPADYVQGLFRVNFNMKARHANSPFRSRNSTPRSTPPPSQSSDNTSSKQSISSSTEAATVMDSISPLSESSTYFTTSEPKAKFLRRYSQDMNDCRVIKCTKDLTQKKDELVGRLSKKLEVLRNEQIFVADECKINDELGETVELYINQVARPHEVAKFRLHVEEVGKITSLLLGLSGRLARAENALMGIAEDHPEKGILECKRDKLLDQLEEAKKLKECIDRRSDTVSNILYKYLSSEGYADYDHFINMKAKLIMDSKEISDKIKLGEEQILALKETLIVVD